MSAVVLTCDGVTLPPGLSVAWVRNPFDGLIEASIVRPLYRNRVKVFANWGRRRCVIDASGVVWCRHPETGRTVIDDIFMRYMETVRPMRDDDDVLGPMPRPEGVDGECGRGWDDFWAGLKYDQSGGEEYERGWDMAVADYEAEQ